LYLLISCTLFFHMLIVLFMNVSIIVHFSLKIIFYRTFCIHSRHLQEVKVQYAMKSRIINLHSYTYNM